MNFSTREVYFWKEWTNRTAKKLCAEGRLPHQLWRSLKDNSARTAEDTRAEKCNIVIFSNWKICEWKVQYERSQQTCAIFMAVWNSFIRPPIIKLNHCYKAQAFVPTDCLYIFIEQEWFADGPTFIYCLGKKHSRRGESTITNVISQQQCLCCWWQWWEWWC